MKTQCHPIILILAASAMVLFSCTLARSNNTTTPPTPPQLSGNITTFDPTDNKHLLIGTGAAPNTHLDRVRVTEEAGSGIANPTIVITGLTNTAGMDGGWALTVPSTAANFEIFSTETNNIPIPNPAGFSPTSVVMNNAITITNLSSNMPNTYDVRVEFAGEAVATWLTAETFTTYFKDATFGGQTARLISDFNAEPATISITGQGGNSLTNIADATLTVMTALPAGYTLTVIGGGGDLTLDASSRTVQADDPDGPGTDVTAAVTLGTIAITRVGDNSGLTFEVVLGPLDALDLTKFNPGSSEHLYVSLTGSRERVTDGIREEDLPGVNPTIVITGLTNTAGMDGGWALIIPSTAANSEIFSTETNNIPIPNPAGFSPTSVVMNNAITITNLNRAGDTDDETNTYDVRVDFAGEAVATWLTAETFTTYFKDATFGRQTARLMPSFSTDTNTSSIITITGQGGNSLTNIADATLTVMTALPAGYTLTVIGGDLTLDANSTTVQADDPDGLGTDVTAAVTLGTIAITRVGDNSGLMFEVVLGPLVKLPKFDPTDSTHLRVSLTSDTNMPLANAMVSVEPAQDATSYPTIVVTGLSNSGFGASDAAVANKWALIVPDDPASTVYRTPNNQDIVIMVAEPTGFAAMEVALETITITNLIFPGDDDNETNTYNVRVDFAAGVGVRLTIRVTSTNVMGGSSDLSLANTETLTVTNACVVLDPAHFAVLMDGNAAPTYAINLARTYYDRNRPQQGDTVNMDTGMISFEQTAEIAEMTDLNNKLGTFAFITTFAPCLAEHLGHNKDGSSAETAYEINSAEHLETVSYLVNASNAAYADKYYTLTEDIDLGLAGAPWSEASGGAGFMPIGKDFSNTFKGNFDCAKHTISNLYINEASVSYRGFFGNVDGGNISHCALTKVAITGGQYVGSLAGQLTNRSTIANTYATGELTSTLPDTNDAKRVGGLVGTLWYNSTIANSYANVAVLGSSSFSGGLVGHAADSTIVNSYSKGSVTGVSYLGSLVGQSYNVTISNSYATGAVMVGSSRNVGGLVGVSGDTFTNAYWDTVATMQSRSAGGIGRTTEELTVARPSSSVYVNWEASIWSFAAGRYPVLRTVACANRQLNPEATTCEDLP